MGFERFEEIEAWQEARKLATEVYKATSVGEWARDFGLRDQVRRAAVSIASNIAEGFARDTDLEFGRFLVIARGSAAEAKTQMYIAQDLGYITPEAFRYYYATLDRICKMLTGLMQYLKKTKPIRRPTVDRRPKTEDLP